MADPHEFDHVMPEASKPQEHNADRPKEHLALRAVWMVLIWMMMSLAQSALAVFAVVQFFSLVVNKNQPNPRLAEVGLDVGMWLAKASRYQTAASETKPWPWTELD